MYHYTQHESCILIEDFVKEALERRKIARDSSRALFEKLNYCYLKISHEIYSMNSYLTVFYKLFNPEFVLMEYVNTDCYHYLNCLMESIRIEYRKKHISRLKSDALYRAKRQAKIISNYSSALLLNRKVMIIRLDLHYRLGIDLPVDRFFSDAESFLSMINCLKVNDSQVTKGMLGYVWKLEQGYDRGFHIHTAFFFNPREVRSDYAKAERLGKVWTRMVKGYGYYYNCNAKLNEYANVGIGVIDGCNQEQYENAINAISYLGKEEQELRIKPKSRRIFGYSGYKAAIKRATRLY